MAGELKPENVVAHWHRTRVLMWTVLTLWLLVGFVIHLFARSLNEIVIFGFPLGFYFAAQGSLIIFVLLIVWYASRQTRIDEEHGVDEEP
jgi:putative solute:sodium symporter small subunit